MYIRDANIIIVVYDLGSKSSFDHVKNWLKEVNDLKKEDAVICYIGNKTDLIEKQVLQEDIDIWTKECGGLHLTLSAKTGDGVDYFFDQLFLEITRCFDLKSDKGEELNVTEKFDLNKLKSTQVKKKKCCGKSN